MSDLVLSAVGDRTAADAIDAGVPPRDVWLALCAETDVPIERRYGVGRLEPRRRLTAPARHAAILLEDLFDLP